MSRGRLSKFISVVIIGVIVMNGLPSMVLADVINTPTFYSVQSDLSYEITTNITSSWTNHENIELVLTNAGNETIHNWYLTFNTLYNIDNIWNGTLYETDGNGTYTITSNGWNQDIHTGESVTVGITFSSDTETELSVDPEWYLLNTQETVVDASQYTLEYTEYSAWETGFTGQLTLTPQVDCQHWELSFGSNREITAVSSAVLISEGENNYAITHDENNMRLFAGTAYNFGIQGVNTEDPLDMSNVELKVVDLAYHLTDDADSNGVPDYLDFIGGGSIVDPTPTPTPVPTDVPTETPTTEPTGTETPTPTEEPTPTPIIDYEADQDLDGLSDYLEEYYFTDPNNPDTDGDGLLDGDEIRIATNPNSIDSDGDGIVDFDEDYDGDGIHNGGEYSTGTCLYSYDSDYDDMDDYQEVYFYGTDPWSEDTDSDGIKDGDEVTLGLNPGSSDSDGDGITDDYVMFSQSLSMEPVADDHPHEITGVSISGNISGLITSNTTIEDTFNRDIYCTDVYGRVGVPINIESEGNFDSMTLTINYDESSLCDTNEADLGVLWYDEESGVFIIQEQAVVDTENNVITVELTHFSTYIVVDLNMWNNPISPDYSDYIMIAEGGTGYYAWHDGIPTLDEEEYECFVWWKLSHGGQYRIVDRIYGYAHTDADPSKIIQLWEYNYTWLVMDTTDSDEDGVFDFIESQGVLGTNNHIYFSNPSEADSDEDGLIDSEEFGSLTIVYNNNGDNIYIQGQIVDGYLYPSVNQSIVYATLKSNPQIKDTDNDSIDDKNDGVPLNSNELISYVFYGNSTDIRDRNTFICEANFRRRMINNEGVRCECMMLSSVGSFIQVWNNMGNNSDGEQVYIIKEVYIISHGQELPIDGESYYSIMLQDGENIWIGDVVGDMYSKHIDSLFLMCCWSGTEINGHASLGAGFLFSNDIGSVYGCDGRLELNFYYCDSMMEDLLFRNLINYGRISYSFNGSSWMLRAYSCDGGNGFIRYYHNDDGSIGQEVLGELTWVL